MGDNNYIEDLGPTLIEYIEIDNRAEFRDGWEAYRKGVPLDPNASQLFKDGHESARRDDADEDRYWEATAYLHYRERI